MMGKMCLFSQNFACYEFAMHMYRCIVSTHGSFQHVHYARGDLTGPTSEPLMHVDAMKNTEINQSACYSLQPQTQEKFK